MARVLRQMQITRFAQSSISRCTTTMRPSSSILKIFKVPATLATVARLSLKTKDVGRLLHSNIIEGGYGVESLDRVGLRPWAAESRIFAGKVFFQKSSAGKTWEEKDQAAMGASRPRKRSLKATAASVRST